MPSNGAPTEEDVDRTILMIRRKAERYGLTRVSFSHRQIDKCMTHQLARIESTLAADGITVYWKQHH